MKKGGGVKKLVKLSLRVHPESIKLQMDYFNKKVQNYWIFFSFNCSEFFSSLFPFGPVKKEHKWKIINLEIFWGSLVKRKRV